MSRIHAALSHYASVRGVKKERYNKPKKLREETKELLEALKHYKKNPSNETRGHLMEEVADVQWCLAAISELGKFDIEDALDLKTARDCGRNRSKSKRNS